MSYADGPEVVRDHRHDSYKIAHGHSEMEVGHKSEGATTLSNVRERPELDSTSFDA